jgi:hypothetical protein
MEATVFLIPAHNDLQKNSYPFAFSALRGRFQYGDLQDGQTRGSCSLSRGIHLWLHRSHR